MDYREIVMKDKGVKALEIVKQAQTSVQKARESMNPWLGKQQPQQQAQQPQQQQSTQMPSPTGKVWQNDDQMWDAFQKNPSSVKVGDQINSAGKKMTIVKVDPKDEKQPIRVV
jgi:hypothetical protein